MVPEQASILCSLVWPMLQIMYFPGLFTGRVNLAGQVAGWVG